MTLIALPIAAHGWTRAARCGRLPITTNIDHGGGHHASIAHAVLLALAAAPGSRQAKKEPIVLRDMGSFHVGGRIVEITGQPVKEVVFTPGGVPAKVDPNGNYQVEQMYVQYFLPQNQQGQVAAAAVARRRPHRRHLRDQARRRRGLAQLFHPQGLGHLRVRRGGARPLRLGQHRSRASRCSCRSAIRGSASASGPPGSWNDDPAKRRSYPGSQFPAEAYRAIHEAGRAALAHHRRRDRRGLYRTGRQGLSLRRAGAQPGRARSATRCWRRGPTR